jgi:hypothetical protein
MKLHHIHVICDYGPGDMAFSEVRAALEGWADHYIAKTPSENAPSLFTFNHASVESFNTVETGFLLAQLGMQTVPQRPQSTVVFANCAPRQDRSEARHNNEGEGLLYGELRSGVKILVVNSGYSLSFVKEDIILLKQVLVDKGGSQFRSRDIFPEAVIRAAMGTLDPLLGDTLNPSSVVHDRPAGVIGYRDSFGNLKTTYRAQDPVLKNLEPGRRFDVVINGITRKVKAATGSFSVDEGEIAFSLGSSGHENRFWEVFQRGGNAWETYGRPRVGAEVKLVL